MNVFHRIVSPLVVALVLSLTGFAEAGVNAFWQELGGSASGNGLSQLPSGNTSASPSVAVGADGRPVVTYVESGAVAGLAPGAVNLLSAADFAILAGSTVTNTGPSNVTGSAGTQANLGVSPGSAVTGFPPGFVNGLTLFGADPSVAQAKLDLTTAYNDAAGRTAPAPVSLAGNIGGQTLAPGLYKSTSTLEISSGDLTLDGGGNPNAVWIFQIASTLTTTSGRQVILAGGAQASNVFWQVGTSATIGTGSTFTGTILADQSITLLSGATLDGRALARIAAVSLDSNIVTKPLGGGSGLAGGGSGGGAAAGAIVVQRWTGSSWQTLSGPNGIGQGFAPQIKISSNGTLHVAWLQDEGPNGVQVHLLRRTTTGSAWEQLGGSNSPGGLTALANGSSVGAFSLASGSDGNPVVAFDTDAQTGIFTGNDGVAQGVSQVYVRRYNGSNAWPYLGTDPSTGGGASNALSLNVTGGYAFHFAANPSLAVQGNGTLVVAFQYGTFYADVPAAGFIPGNTEIFVTHFSSNTSTWTALGPAVPTVDDGTTAQGGIGGVSNNAGVSGAPALAIRGITPTTNEIWVAWLEGDNVFARRSNGPIWEEFGGSGSSDGISDPSFINGDPDVTVDTGGNPVVTWSSKSLIAPRQVFVKRADSGFFTEMGQDSADGAGISDAAINAFTPMVAAPPSGTAGPAVVWIDQKAGNTQVFLRQFTTATAFTLNVSVVGNGSSVSSTPIGIACPGDPDGCSGTFPSGQVVSLTPNPGPNQKFIGWAGNCTGAGACNVAMTANRTITATFASGFTLTVSKLGNGAPFVTVTSGNGINCGTDCSEVYLPGAVVTLSTTLPTGTLFGGWGGACGFRGTNLSCPLTMNAGKNVSATFTQRKQLLTVQPGAGQGFALSSPAGIDCGNFGGHTDCTELYDYGTTVALTPVTGIDSRFEGWTGCSRLNGSVCLVDMTANRTVAERFGNARTLNVAASGNGAGKITANTTPPLVCTNGITGCAVSQLVPFGQSVMLTPATTTGSNFQWAGGVCIGSSTCTTVMTQNRSATGLFTLNHHRLDVTRRFDGTVVSTNLIGDVVDCGTLTNDCSTIQDFNTLVHLQATADTGLVFVNWTGTSPCSLGARATNASCLFQIQGNVTATPNYRPGTVVTLTKSGNGKGTVGATGTLSPSPVSCGPACTQTTFTAFDGDPVNLTATPAIGSRFVNLTGDCVSNSPLCSFIPGGAGDTVNAQFVLEQFTLRVANNQDGTVASSTPSGIITCGLGGSDCTEELDFDTQVRLVATPNADAVFINWTGTVCNGSANATCLFKVPAGQVTLTPNYRGRTVVSVVKTGNGSGLVTSSSGGINCGTGANCSKPIFDNMAVKLTAAAGLGSSFTGFSGACVSTTTTCTFVPTGANQSVSANFQKAAETLTTTVTGDGFVTVGSVTCQPTCQFPALFGDTLVVLAHPNNGNKLLSFTGCTSTNGSTCSVLMTANKTVGATFSTMLTITKTGNGTVTPSLPGAPCGPGCSTYTPGTSVTLTEIPGSGSAFAGWGGDCLSRGLNTSCTVVLTQNRVVSAAFSLPLTLTVTKLGSGNGSVTSSPGGITCPGDCSQAYAFGTPVTLTATAASGSIFSGFGIGSCDSQPSNVSCRVSMTSNRTVTASFNVPAMGVSLGSAATFAGLGGSAGMTNQGLSTVVNGNIGTTGASTLITGFHDANDPYTETPLNAGLVTGTIFSAAPAPGTIDRAATAAAALADATTAFNALSPASMPGGIDVGNGELGGRTLAPGVYKSAPGTYAITLVDLVLDGQGNPNAVWVFQMASTLTVGTPTGARSVMLINGAQAKNVFWQVGSAATINAAGGGTMVGTIIASSGAAFSTAGNNLPEQVVTLNGRALGLNASVTLVNTVISLP